MDLPKKQTPETRKKIAASLRGRLHSEEHRRKIGESVKARWAARAPKPAPAQIAPLESTPVVVRKERRSDFIPLDDMES